MAGHYKRIIITVDLGKVIQDFKDFALQTSPDFRCCDAVRKKIWNSHISRKLQLTFNSIKKMAELPVTMERRREGNPEINKIAGGREYESVKPPKKLKGAPIKPCLGQLQNDTHCENKVPKGQYFCPRCRDRKNSL